MSGIYVTETGFIKKTLAEIKIELEDAYKEEFGNDIDLDPESPFGQQIGIQAKALADTWDGLAEIYTARNPQEATGTSLDYIVSENFIIRLDAQPTTVRNVLLTGDEGTPIPAGSRIRAENIPEFVYEIDTPITITAATLRKALIEPDAPGGGGEDFTVTINTVNYIYTTTAGDTAEDVIDGLIALITAGAWAGSATKDGAFLVLTDITDDFSLTVSANITIDTISSGADFTGLTPGSISAPANTLDFIVTPVSGWDEVINPQPGTIGREVETDEELRIRRQLITAEGYATEDAIRTALIQNVDNVTGASVISNRSNSVDGEGRPAKSFEAVISGGTNTEVAQEIWKRMPAGIESFGNVSEVITDSQGQEQTINFSRAIPIYIWVRVSRELYDEEIYPATGDVLIKQAIVDWSLNRNNIDLDKDVIRQRLSVPIYSVPGIGEILIEIDGTANTGDTPTYTESNVVIGAREIAVFNVARIIVQDLI